MFLESIAITTTRSVVGALPSGPVAEVAAAELIHEAHVSEDGIEVAGGRLLPPVMFGLALDDTWARPNK